MKYVTCEKCGAHLDHGETCDCEKRSPLYNMQVLKAKGTDTYLIYNEGGYSPAKRKGHAVIITLPDGSRPRLYSKVREVNGKHGLVKVYAGCFVIKVVHSSADAGRYSLRAYRIIGFQTVDHVHMAVCELVHESESGWTRLQTSHSAKLYQAMNSAVYMAQHENNVRAYYIR